MIGELGELYAEIELGLKRHKLNAPGSDGRLGNDFIEVKTISPMKQDDMVRVKRQGNFNKLFLVKISENFFFESRMIDRRELKKGDGKFATARFGKLDSDKQSGRLIARRLSLDKAAEYDDNILMKNDTIASRIRSAREQAQMQPAELRRLLRDDYGIDLSKTGLHRLETVEAKNPNLKQIQAIAKITHVSPSWILFGEGTSVSDDQVGSAIRSRVIDTIELMVGALDLTARQDSTIRNWLKSVRASQPGKARKP